MDTNQKTATEARWPQVDQNDGGIRPAGAPDACFYCGQRVGQPHGPECVCVTKRVKLRYTFEIEVDVPHAWGQHQIEFHRNEGSWCANNAISDIEAFSGFLESVGHCLCVCFRCEYVGLVNETPRRDLKGENDEASV